MKFKTNIVIILSILCLAPAAAQVVYHCDFEDEAERAQWLLNDGPRADKCPNIWYMGAAANTTQDGEYGLFVSNNGQTAEYSGSTNMYAVAVLFIYHLFI